MSNEKLGDLLWKVLNAILGNVFLICEAMENLG